MLSSSRQAILRRHYAIARPCNRSISNNPSSPPNPTNSPPPDPSQAYQDASPARTTRSANPTRPVIGRARKPHINIHTGEEVDAQVKALGVVADEGLPFLPRPLGVPDKPTTAKLTWEEKKQKMLDWEEHLKERRHLLKELASKGYWSDMNRLSEYGGKMWIGAPALIRDEASLYFPDMEGKTLTPSEDAHTTDMCANHISIIAILTTVMSDSHVKSFVESTLSKFEKDPLFRFVQINLQENALKSFLVKLFTARMRGQVPEKFHSTYMLSHQNMEYVRDALGLLNKHVGYVYLVDENLKIRWAGCGFARSEERDSLLACTAELITRLNSSKKK